MKQQIKIEHATCGCTSTNNQCDCNPCTCNPCLCGDNCQCKQEKNGTCNC